MMKSARVFLNPSFQIVCGVSLIIMMMVAAIVPAFPSIMQFFKIDENTVGWLITAFSLPAFIFGPLGGIVADRLGRKRVLVTSLLLFGIFGGACAFCTDFTWLLILRTIHGMVSAPLGSLGITIIGDIFSGTERAEAMGFNNTIMYVGYIIYPALGGVLAVYAWNYPFLLFFLALPLGLIALIFLKSPEPQNAQGLRQYFGDSMQYLKSWKVAWLFAAAILTYIFLYGAFLVYFTILLSSRFNSTSVTIGLMISALGIGTAVTSLFVGRLNRFFSPTSLIIISFLVYAISMAIVPVMPTLWSCFLPAIVFGIAHGLNLPSISVVGSRIAPLEHRAGFMAIQSTMIPLGMTLAAPVMGLFNNLTNLNTSFYIVALISCIIPITAIFVLRKKQQRQEY